MLRPYDPPNYTLSNVAEIRIGRIEIVLLLDVVSAHSYFKNIKGGRSRSSSDAVEALLRTAELRFAQCALLIWLSLNCMRRWQIKTSMSPSDGSSLGANGHKMNPQSSA